MDGTPISVTLGGDHGYFLGIFVTAHSICRSARPGTSLLLHVYDLGLEEGDRQVLKSLETMFHDRSVRVHMFEPDVRPFESFPKYHGSHATFARLLLQDLISDEWTIYVDVDLLWLKCVNELWEMRDPRFAIFAVPDGSGFCEFSEAAALAEMHFPQAGGKAPAPGGYYGAGVAMLNLAKLRELRFTSRVLEMIPDVSSVFTYNDQDFYNFLLPSPTLARLIDPSWNAFACHWGTFGVDNQVIHYAGWIPWRKGTKIRRVIMLWWEYLAGIGWEVLGSRAVELRREYRMVRSRYRRLRNPVALAFLRLFCPKQYRKRLLRLVPTPYDPARGGWCDPDPSGVA